MPTSTADMSRVHQHSVAERRSIRFMNRLAGKIYGLLMKAT